MAALSWSNSLLSSDYADLTGVKAGHIFEILSQLIGQGKCALLCKVIAFLIVLSQAVFINLISNTLKFFDERTQLPGLVFLIISANLYNYQYLHPILIANMFLILSWWIITSIYNQANNKGTIFNAAFVVALSSLFYPAYTYFMVFILAAVLLNVESRFKDIIMTIFGFVTVWYLYLSLNYIITDSTDLQIFTQDLAVSKFEIGKLSTPMLIFSAYALILFLFSSLYVLFNVAGSKVFVRLNVKLLFVWIILGAVIRILGIASNEIFYSIAIPVSVLFSIYFVNSRNAIVREIFWALLILFTILNNFMR